MSEKNNKDDNLSISSKTARLNELVAWFDSEDFVLEEAIEKYETAQKLAAEIEEDLLNLKNEINIVKQKFDA